MVPRVDCTSVPTNQHIPVSRPTSTLPLEPSPPGRFDFLPDTHPAPYSARSWICPFVRLAGSPPGLTVHCSRETAAQISAPRKLRFDSGDAGRAGADEGVEDHLAFGGALAYQHLAHLGGILGRVTAMDSLGGDDVGDASVVELSLALLEEEDALVAGAVVSRPTTRSCAPSKVLPQRRPNRVLRSLMNVAVAKAAAHDRPVIEALLDAYLAELSSHRDNPIGATDAASYRYLDLYWSAANRHPFLIRADDHVVGFVLAYEPSAACKHLAEFYIAPRWRRLGIGRSAVALLWSQLPGAWELQVHAANQTAARFWTCCVSSLAEDANTTETTAADGRRIQYTCVARKTPSARPRD